MPLIGVLWTIERTLMLRQSRKSLSCALFGVCRVAVRYLQGGLSMHIWVVGFRIADDLDQIE